VCARLPLGRKMPGGIPVLGGMGTRRRGISDACASSRGQPFQALTARSCRRDSVSGLLDPGAVPIEVRRVTDAWVR
jgi:hypothetical protein